MLIPLAAALAIPLPDSPPAPERSVCWAEVHGTSVTTRGCPSWVDTQALGWDGLRAAAGSHPHPVRVTVAERPLRRYRVNLSPQGNRVRVLPVARVRSAAPPVLIHPPTVWSCDVDVSVDRGGSVTQARAPACPVADEVVRAALSWRLRPLVVAGVPEPFEARLVVQLPRPPAEEAPAGSIESLHFR